MFRFIFKIVKIACWSLLLWLFVRAFLFQTCKIPSESMCGTLQQGNYILINKTAYGTRLPITPLSIAFGNKHYSLDFAELPYFRLPGYSSVKRNDIIVFNFPQEEGPIDQRKKQIKRCIALPGDTVRIFEGKVFINGKAFTDNPSILYRYSFSNLSDTTLIKKLNPYSYSPAHLHFLITKQKSDSIERTNKIVPANKDLLSATMYRPDFFPHSPLFKWNPDFFGPLWIPKKGTSVALTDSTFALYATLIEKNEGVAIKQLNHIFYVNGELQKSYTFTQDYYFVLGDNRYNSIDSRYWGLLPESHLIGKYSFVIFE